MKKIKEKGLVISFLIGAVSAFLASGFRDTPTSFNEIMGIVMFSSIISFFFFLFYKITD